MFPKARMEWKKKGEKGATPTSGKGDGCVRIRRQEKKDGGRPGLLSTVLKLGGREKEKKEKGCGFRQCSGPYLPVPGDDGGSRRGGKEGRCFFSSD